MSTLYLDIETLPGDPGDPKSALDHARCVVLCVGVAWDDDPARCLWGTTERDTVALLDAELREVRPELVVTHNGSGFDLPVLWKRGVKYGYPRMARRFYQEKPWTRGFCDTCLVWSCSPRPAKGSGLSAVAEWLGIERPPTIPGADVAEAYEAGRLEDIRAHVLDDVETLRKVYGRLYAAGVL